VALGLVPVNVAADAVGFAIQVSLILGRQMAPVFRHVPFDIRHAKWVCFITQDDFLPAGFASRLDSFLLLTIKPSLFFFDVYRKGMLSESEIATLHVRRISFSDSTSWKPSKNSSGAMDVTLDSDKLRITRKYQNHRKEAITYKFVMRLSTGEFSATSTFVTGWTIHHSGNCTELPQDGPQP